MGIFNEHPNNKSSSNSNLSIQGPPGIGFKLDSNGNYDLNNKHIKNISDGTQDKDVV